MDEGTALALLDDLVDEAGDDAAVLDGHVLSTDMLHANTDFPTGVTRYTAGWRAVGASLSDIAAMGAEALGAVAAYGAPHFDNTELRDFVAGAQAVCNLAETAYVGGDLDTHDEFTVATTALGRTTNPILRSGASPGDHVYVTGELGRSLAAMERFEDGDIERANELFQFTPRVVAGRTIASAASAMIDSSDGLARSLHQLTAASDCGVAISSDRIPIISEANSTAEAVWYHGEDFELIFTGPPDAVRAVMSAVPVRVTDIGRVTAVDVTIDDRPLPDRGYQHGSNS